jgi:arylsulfatase A-like enzyme
MSSFLYTVTCIYGPDSREIRAKIRDMDKILGYLLSKFDTNKLWDKVNLIVTSDHGMTTIDTSNQVVDITYIWSITPDLCLTPRPVERGTGQVVTTGCYPYRFSAIPPPWFCRLHTEYCVKHGVIHTIPYDTMTFFIQSYNSNQKGTM